MKRCNRCDHRRRVLRDTARRSACLTAGKRGVASLPFGSRIVLIEPDAARPGPRLPRGPGLLAAQCPRGQDVRVRGASRRFLRMGTRARPAGAAAAITCRAPGTANTSPIVSRCAKQRSPRWLKFEHVRARATGLGVDDGLATVTLSNGAVIEADRVLLALGNSPTAGPVPDAPDAVADASIFGWMESGPTSVTPCFLVGTQL